jgi:hypothetical protein
LGWGEKRAEYSDRLLQRNNNGARRESLNIPWGSLKYLGFSMLMR